MPIGSLRIKYGRPRLVQGITRALFVPLLRALF